MDASLSCTPRLQRLSRRGTVLLAIISLHVLAAVAVSAVKRPSLPVAHADPIHVVFLQDAVQERWVDRIPSRLQELRVDLSPPDVNFPISDVQTPTAITLLPPAQRQQPVTATDNGLSTEVAISVLELKPPSPRYPAAAKRARAQGTVVLNVLIDIEGHVKDVLVHRTSGFQQLDMAARDAMWEALFRPYRENGVARSVRGNYEVKFALTVRTASAS